MEVQQSCKHYVDNGLIKSKINEKEKYTYNSPHANFDWK